MEEQIQKSYYAVIPANVRYDKNLIPNAKLLYGEITALCNEKGYCWAGNGYFAELYGVSKTSISKWVKSLIDGGYIVSEMVYKQGTKEIDKRYIRIVNDPIQQKLKTPITKVKDPIEEKLKGNNTFNTKSNNIINNTSIIKDIVEYLNAKAETNFKATTKSTQQHIHARLEEGFNINDFRTVIDKKCLDWKGTEFEQYLRPQTLFGTKFESYLNAPVLIKRQNKSTVAVEELPDDVKMLFGE